jgi:hypothetical protein
MTYIETAVTTGDVDLAGIQGVHPYVGPCHQSQRRDDRNMTDSHRQLSAASAQAANVSDGPCSYTGTTRQEPPCRD